MIRQVWQAVRKMFRASTTRSPDRWFVDWLRGDDADSGISMSSPRDALRYAPIWYSVTKIGGNIGMMPLILYERRGERDTFRAKSHPSYRLVKKRPNPMMNASTFRETLQLHALLTGNGRAAIDRDASGKPVAIIPLLPSQTKTVLVNGEKWHVANYVTDTTTGETRSIKLPDRDVLHIAGLSYDGVTGYSVIDIARNSWGLGLAAEKHGNRLFRNNAVPGLLLEAPPGVFADDQDAKKFLNEFREMHEGLDNAGKAALLREGIKANPLSVNGRDSQWIEQRLFQRQEAALWFAIESILGDDKSVSYNSQEQKQLAYLVNCLSRWMVKWEEECDEKLLTAKQKLTDSHYFKFQTGALLRADMKTTIDTLGVAITHRIMNPNEAREKLEMNSYAGGDEYANPAITPGVAQPAVKPAANHRAMLEHVIADRLLDVQRIEKRRVAQAATRPDFDAWCERFYSSADWSQTLERVVTQCGGAPALATQYCEHSRATLLAANASGDRVAAVEAALATWPQRAAALAAELVEQVIA